MTAMRLHLLVVLIFCSLPASVVAGGIDRPSNSSTERLSPDAPSPHGSTTADGQEPVGWSPLADFKELSASFAATAGAGLVFDSKEAHVAFSAGVDVLLLQWGFVAWSAAEARIFLYRTCPDSTCGFHGSFLVGSRPALAIDLDASRHHRLLIGAALGWGSVGDGFSNRSNTTGLVVSPGIRYLFRGRRFVAAVELTGFLPAYSVGPNPYPAGVALNLALGHCYGC